VGEEGCGDVCFLNIALEFCRENWPIYTGRRVTYFMHPESCQGVAKQSGKCTSTSTSTFTLFPRARLARE